MFAVALHSEWDSDIMVLIKERKLLGRSFFRLFLRAKQLMYQCCTIAGLAITPPNTNKYSHFFFFL